MKQQPRDLSRRSLFKTLTVGCLAGATIATSNAVQAKAGAVNVEETVSGYRQTAHINNYYNSLRS